MQKKADLLLHPIRMRVIQALVSNPNQTVQQLLEKLGDVPQATMYRHLKLLVDAGLIIVVETNKVRGTQEKVYAVVVDQLQISDQEIEETSQADHLRYFVSYQANLLKEFERYVMSHSPSSYKEDGLGFWQTTLHLNEEEMQELAKKIAAVIQEATEKKPREDRTAKTLATILIPDSKKE